MMIGTTVSHYRITDKLGEGGMGEVYRAEDLRLERTVALKFLPPEWSRDPDVRERFIREARAASALDHPNICTIHEIDETDEGRLFIAMAYYEGDTLRDRIEQGPLPIDQAIGLAIQMVAGLQRAHEAGIVHRDVKPANVIITDRGEAKIVDFGLVRLVQPVAPEAETEPPSTEPGLVMGTVGYMSPEQVRGDPADHRSDIFALGCTLYEMLTGRRAFQGKSPAETMAQILKEQPEPVSELRAEVAPELDAIVDRAIQKDASVRYQRTAELLSDLEAVRRRYQEPRIAPIRWLRRRRGTAAVFLAAVLVLVVGAAVLIRNRQRSERIASIISELRPAAEAGRFDDVFAELSRRSVTIGEVGDPGFTNAVAGTVSIESEPTRAAVELARVLSRPELSLQDPVDLGRTPIEGRLLVAGEYFARLTIEGRPPVELLVTVEPGRSVRVVRHFVTAELAGMTRVEAGVSPSGQTVPAFLIDRHEVTNEEYFRFVSVGGYREPALWPESLVIDTGPVPWDIAMTRFVDQTGLNGPRYWSDGTYPDGRHDHPVVGVSWYEAMAYARWAGKELPSLEQWWRAALGGRETVFPWGNDVMSTHLRANFGMRGTQAVGSLPLGISPFGCFEMAGNVREWVGGSESVDGLRTVVGGSWKYPSYMFEASHSESFDARYARDDIGFRCAESIAGQ